MFEPKRTMLPSMWHIEDLVMVETRDGCTLSGLIIDTTPQYQMYERPSWRYHVLVDGKILLMFESKSGSYRIIRRVNSTSEDAE